MDSGLREKVVFLTGASGGIGRETARAFAEEGARLILLGHSQFGELEEFVSAQPWNERAICLRANVADRRDLFAAMEEANRAFGRVDACVANAGIWPREDVPFHEMDEGRIRGTLDTNLLGAAWTAQAFVSQLARVGPRADGHGAALVFVGSTAGRFGERDHTDYSISKAGMYGMVRSLKNEIVRVDPFGRVNMVEPGWTVTHMARPALDDDGIVRRVAQTLPVQQLGRARDIAHTIAFLCSPLLARHVSGEILTVSGGMEGRVLWEAEQIDLGRLRRRIRDEE